MSQTQNVFLLLMLMISCRIPPVFAEDALRDWVLLCIAQGTTMLQSAG